MKVARDKHSSLLIRTVRSKAKRFVALTPDQSLLHGVGDGNELGRVHVTGLDLPVEDKKDSSKLECFRNATVYSVEQLGDELFKFHGLIQGSLTEGEGSVQLTSLS